MGNDDSNGKKPPRRRETIEELRTHLFGTIQDLRNPESGMDVDKAKAIKGIADTIIDSARAELKAYEVAGVQMSDFVSPAARLGHDAKGDE